MERRDKINVLMVSLGCDKNRVDSEYMLGLLRDGGYTLTDEEEKADVVIVNTCCFIQDAKEESIQTILEMAKLKEESGVRSLIVTGCLSQRYRDEMRKELPEVDAILGTTSFDEIVTAIEESLRGKKPELFRDKDYTPSYHGKRVNSTSGHYAYLKIAEGCDKRCTYCVIPSVRGRYRSLTMESILEQANALVRDGAKELIVVAQETTRYGVDLYGEKKLPELLVKLCNIRDLRWIRILYAYPEEVTDELVEVIKKEDKICKYMDIPIQHASNEILKKMGRNTNKEEIEALIANLRQEIPDIVLRTTLITGFPTETWENHEELMDFVKTMRFDRLGVFPYSEEEGTPAARLRPKVSNGDKKKRYQELMQAQQEVAFQKMKEKVHAKMHVFVEGRLIEEDGVYFGRTYMDAPDIDGYLFFSSEQSYESGDFVEVEVTKTKGYDLIGREWNRDEFTE